MPFLTNSARKGSIRGKVSLKIAVCGAEPWTNAMREEIEEAFDLHAIDTYGLSEVIGPGVSSECIETKDGCTIWEDHFYPEVIDPATGAVLPDGEVGELVFTSLTKEAMPVIRYRTRDLSRLLPGTARSMRRMEKVIGRSDDMMIIRGVNVFPSQIEEILLKDERVSPHFVIELRREERLDSMTVLVEARPGIAEAEWPKSGRDLAHHIKSMIGVTAEVKAVKPGSIERSAGKAKRVIDLRAKKLARRLDQFGARTRELLVHVHHEGHGEDRRRQVDHRDRHEHRDHQPGEKHHDGVASCALPWPRAAGGSAWRRARNIHGRAGRRSPEAE